MDNNNNSKTDEFLQESRVTHILSQTHGKRTKRLFVNESITHLPISDVARVSVQKPHENFFGCEYHHDFRFSSTPSAFAKYAAPYRRIYVISLLVNYGRPLVVRNLIQQAHYLMRRHMIMEEFVVYFQQKCRFIAQWLMQIGLRLLSNVSYPINFW